MFFKAIRNQNWFLFVVNSLYKFVILFLEKKAKWSPWADFRIFFKVVPIHATKNARIVGYYLPWMSEGLIKRPKKYSH